MESIADIVIIGGGAAGLMAGIAAAAGKETGKEAGTADSDAMDNSGETAPATSVLVLEKMPRPGRKIMISGKGRCNFSNISEWQDFAAHIHPKADFLKPAFYSFPPQRMMSLLEESGCPCVVERGNRAFPESHRAADVVDALERKLKQEGARLVCGTEVMGIRPVSQGVADRNNMTAGMELESRRYRFRIVLADGRELLCRRLIISTGGLSYPGSGSTGDGYRWTSELGHRLTPRFPSLTALVPKGYKSREAGRTEAETARTGGSGLASGLTSGPAFGSSGLKGHIARSTPLSEWGKTLQGIQLKNVRLSLEADGNVALSEFGDLDFTDGGLEGPIGFKVSRTAVKTMVNGGKVRLHIDLKPAVESNQLGSRVESMWKEISADSRSWTVIKGKRVLRPHKERFQVLLNRLLPSELVKPFMVSIPDIDLRNICRYLKDWTLDIEGFVGYERCVVTAGGVSLNEVKKKTMESSLVPGLYFCGEVLDLDADTGGYNLQTAFSTGFLAGSSAAASL